MGKPKAEKEVLDWSRQIYRREDRARLRTTNTENVGFSR